MVPFISRKPARCLLVPSVCLFLLLLFWWSFSSKRANSLMWARVISATQLMDMVEKGQTPYPRIIHQSWTTQNVPLHFEDKRVMWRQFHDGNWIYVLWTEADNHKLAHHYFPQHFKVYNALSNETHRAEMARYMYMYQFGGVYADLDMTPHGPLPLHLPILKTDTPPPPTPIAYIGREGDDNAYLISTHPSHQFWLKNLDYVKERFLESGYTSSRVETVTGALGVRTCYEEWEREREVREGKGYFGEVRILPPKVIYRSQSPYYWKLY
ncbi:hypothetical protein CPB86DRAFT_875488 [Serendipita vermifera]|nr:hypothetical protein CPB86DRAFT_875488 [Serendipita vermifera]